MSKAAPLESRLNSNNYKDMKMAVIWVLWNNPHSSALKAQCERESRQSGGNKLEPMSLQVTCVQLNPEWSEYFSSLFRERVHSNRLLSLTRRAPVFTPCSRGLVFDALSSFLFFFLSCPSTVAHSRVTGGRQSQQDKLVQLRLFAQTHGQPSHSGKRRPTAAHIKTLLRSMLAAPHR